MGLKFKVVDETVAAEILSKLGQSIVGSDHGKRCMRFVKIQCSLALGSAMRSLSKFSINYT